MSCIQPPLRAATALAAALALALAPIGPTARARTAHPSDASRASLQLLALPSVAAGALPVLFMLKTGDALELSVRAVEVSGREVLVTLGLPDVPDALLPLRLSAEVVRGLGITVGVPVVVTAVASGLIVGCKGRALGIIPRPKARGFLHEQRITEP